MSPGQRELTAAAIALALVALAALAGVGASRLAVRPPTPSPLARPSASPVPSPTEIDTGPFVFAQQLSAGCAAGAGVYVVSDGGGIGRFDGERWSLVDDTSRSLAAATCAGARLLAVGGGGRVVTVDDAARVVRVDMVQLDDLLAVAPLGDGVLAAGRRGSVIRQDLGGWLPYAQGIDEDLFAVAAFGDASAWVVGAGGASFRLEPAGWRPVATGVTADLRVLAARSVDDVIAAGDDGVVLEWTGRWTRLGAEVPRVTYRAAARLGDAVYLAGDRGTLVRLSGTAGARQATVVPLSATCTLRGLFVHQGELWAIGSDGGRGAVWRLGAAGTTRWGDCP